MDWLEKHIDKIDYYDKVLECIDGEGKPRVVKGIYKKVSINKI